MAAGAGLAGGGSDGASGCITYDRANRPAAAFLMIDGLNHTPGSVTHHLAAGLGCGEGCKD